MKGVGSLIVGNLASKGLGVAREVLFAAWFGTGETAVAFRVAQTGYLLPTQALVGDSLSAGLVPLYRKIKAEDEAQSRLLLLVAFSYALVFSAIVSALLYSFSTEMAEFIAPGASVDAKSLAARLLKILALSTPFFLCSSIMSYLETAHGHYGPLAWRPLILNIGSIAGAALAVFLNVDEWLAWGLLASHIALFVWSAIKIRHIGRIMPDVRPTLGMLAKMFRQFFLHLLPLLGLPLVAQANVVFERNVSSWIGGEVIPAADYARFLCDTVLQLIAVPLGIHTMAKFGGESGDQIKAHIGSVTSTIIVIALPISLYVSMNAATITQVFFARGAFDENSVAVTSSVLTWMALGLAGHTIAYYLIKALNAQLRNGESLIYTALSVFVNVVLNLVLWRYLGPAAIGVGALGYGLSQVALAIWANRIWGAIRMTLLWAMLGLGAYVLLARVTPPPSNALGALAVDAALLCSIWLALIVFVDPVKKASAPVLSKLPILKALVG